MNIDVHIFTTRDGQWKARITHSGGMEYVGKCGSIESLMLQLKRGLLLLEKDTQ